MKRLNLTFFVELGGLLSPLAKVPPHEDPISEDVAMEFRIMAIRASAVVTRLLNDKEIPLAIPASRPEAEALLKLVQELRRPAVNRASMWEVYWHADRLLTLLSGELAVQSVYHIWPKRAFDTNLMIEGATALFSPDVQAWLAEEEKYNILQAGKCIAFETPTAAGFHLIRATESVIRRYYKLVVGTEPALKMRNWGVYIKNLKKCGGEPRVIHALEQIKDLHRNPVIHPDVALSVEEAISLIGITESIIGAIFADMMRREKAIALPPPAPKLTLATIGSGLAATVEPVF